MPNSSEKSNRDWPTTVDAAQAVQSELRDRVSRHNSVSPTTLRLIAGVDVGFEQGGKVTRAAVVVMDYLSLQPVEYQLVRQPTRFPYVPGYLSFRECPAILSALDALQQRPELLLCDGQGIAHPRRFGVASHLGVLTGLPSIGVAKSRLVGSYTEPGQEKGEWQPLWDRDERIGTVLRSRRAIKPLFVSIGHAVDLPTAVKIVMHCCQRYRLPEPIRLADRLASDRSAMPPVVTV